MTLKLTEENTQIWGDNLPFWFVVLARLGSLFLMACGLFYWADILGVFGTSGLERDSGFAATARVLLACAFLISSVGVWQLTFWGVVVWVLSVIGQTVAVSMLDAFSSMALVLTFFHFLALLALSASAGWILYQSMRQDED